VVVRVLWIVKGLGPGGAERLLVTAARLHDSHSVELECAYVLPWKDHLAGELEAAGVRCHCLSRRRRDPFWPLALRSLVAERAYDVVHVHSPLPGSVARVAVASLPPARRPATMSTEHNTWDTHRLPTRWLNRATSRLDRATFAVTDEAKRSMSGVAREQAEVLTHGIDVEAVGALREQRNAVRAELGLADGDLVVGTVANFRPQKDYPTLLRAMAMLHERGVSARLMAVGQGPDEADTRQLAGHLGVADIVHFTGFRPDAVRLLAAADVFTLASAWEGLPVALMEALALGLPVVATQVGGVAETMRDGVDALLVPPKDPAALADALQRVLTDPRLRTRLAEAASAKAAAVDAHHAVRELEDTYRRLTTASAMHRPPAATARVLAVAEPPDGLAAGLDIRPAVDADLPAVLDLLQRALAASDPRYADLFTWKHRSNPFGPSPMWVATDDGRVVAFRTFMRWEFVRGGSVLRAVRAVDTATDPEYRGRGLFRALTLHGLERLRDEGVCFVFNTPNDQSRPGYLTMGWREVGRLAVSARFAALASLPVIARATAPADRWSLPLEVGEPAGGWFARRAIPEDDTGTADVRRLRTHQTEAFLAWRYGTPLLGYRVVAGPDAAVVVRLRRRGAARELAVVARMGHQREADRLAGQALRASGADYALRLGSASPAAGFVRVPRAGPRLTWRGLADPGMPPLPQWQLSLGDIELF
jgi:L-malate glycosyltransferase